MTISNPAGSITTGFSYTADLFIAGAGSATAPSYTFSGDLNTGMYSPGADQIGFTTGGTLRLTLSTTALTSTLPFTAPGLIVNGSTVVANGLYLPSANTVGVATNGVLRASWSTALFTSALPLSVTDATQSTSSATGAIITAGGVGIAKNLFVGGTIGFTSTNLIEPFSGGMLFDFNGTYAFALLSKFARLSNDGMLGWDNTGTAYGGAPDTAIARTSAGIMEINNGTAGTLRDISVRTIIIGASAAADAALVSTHSLTVSIGGSNFKIMLVAA
jgi:hypothetical protein